MVSPSAAIRYSPSAAIRYFPSARPRYHTRLERDQDGLQHGLRVRPARRALLGAEVLPLRDGVRVTEAVRVAAVAAVGAGHRLFDHLLQLGLVFLDLQR